MVLSRELSGYGLLISSCRQMALTVPFFTSRWRGTGATLPLVGFFQMEWLPPSRARKHPFSVRWRTKSPSFTKPRVEVPDVLHLASRSCAIPRGDNPSPESAHRASWHLPLPGFPLPKKPRAILQNGTYIRPRPRVQKQPSALGSARPNSSRSILT